MGVTQKVQKLMDASEAEMDAKSLVAINQGRKGGQTFVEVGD